jgi:hypothetical protein
MNRFHLGGRAFHSRSLSLFHLHSKISKRFTKPPRRSATQRKPTYFRYHANPREGLLLPHSLTPHQPVRRIWRLSKLPLSFTF